MRAEIENLVNNAKNGIFTQRDLINDLLKVSKISSMTSREGYRVDYNLIIEGVEDRVGFF